MSSQNDLDNFILNTIQSYADFSQHAFRVDQTDMLMVPNVLDQWRQNFQYALGPTNPAFVDAALSHQDILVWGYTLQYNQNGVLWRVDPAGRPHPDDYRQFLEQNRILQKATERTAAEMRSLLETPQIEQTLSQAQPSPEESSTVIRGSSHAFDTHLRSSYRNFPEPPNLSLKGSFKGQGTSQPNGYTHTGQDGESNTSIRELNLYNMTDTVARNAVTPKYVYLSGKRTAEAYNQLIDQFDVEHNPRYVPRDNQTFCNIFVWDVSVAMGVELPRFVEVNEVGNWEDATGKAIGRTPINHIVYTENATATELTADRLATWLEVQGKNYGWREVNAQEAQERANQGYMTISVNFTSHTQVVRPTPARREYGKGVYVAEAGDFPYITNGAYFVDKHGAMVYTKYRFYTHD